VWGLIFSNPILGFNWDFGGFPVNPEKFIVGPEISRGTLLGTNWWGAHDNFT